MAPDPRLRLDALIAEKFGSFTDIRELYGRYFGRREGVFTPIPPYSTDQALCRSVAGQVWERTMKAIFIQTTFRNDKTAFYPRVKSATGIITLMKELTAPTEELAVCFAALKLIGAEIPTDLLALLEDI